MRRARRNGKLPTVWLFTDERLGGECDDDPLWSAIDRLPRGAGIVFRHYGLPTDARRALLRKVRQRARGAGLILIGSAIDGAPDGVHRPRHDPARCGRGLITASAHGRREALEAFARGADAVFLSPVFPTRSHPGGAALGPVRFGLSVRGIRKPVIALGGMTDVRFRRLQPFGAYGWAAIDGLRALPRR